MARGKSTVSVLPPRSILTAHVSFVEFETAQDLNTAVEKLDGREFKEKTVTCVANVSIPNPVH